MYVWIWHRLPGGVSLKALQVFVIVAAVSALLLFVVFPYVEPHLPFNKASVGNSSG